MRVCVHPSTIDFIVHYIRPEHLASVIAEVQCDSILEVVDKYVVVSSLQINPTQLVTVGEDQIRHCRVVGLTRHPITLHAVSLVAMTAVRPFPVGAVLATAPSHRAHATVVVAGVVVPQE